MKVNAQVKSTDSVLDHSFLKSQYFDCSIQVVKKENKNTESSYLNIQTVIKENEKIKVLIQKLYSHNIKNDKPTEICRLKGIKQEHYSDYFLDCSHETVTV